MFWTKPVLPLSFDFLALTSLVVTGPSRRRRHNSGLTDADSVIVRSILSCRAREAEGSIASSASGAGEPGTRAVLLLSSARLHPHEAENGYLCTLGRHPATYLLAASLVFLLLNFN